jgi:hypothetical protein
VPPLNEDGCIGRVILQQMADGLPLHQIARKMASRFSHRFAAWQDALNPVADLYTTYSL